jgi:hypothetical protein
VVINVGGYITGVVKIFLDATRLLGEGFTLFDVNSKISLLIQNRKHETPRVKPVASPEIIKS